jgi:hypothetical protein
MNTSSQARSNRRIFVFGNPQGNDRFTPVNIRNFIADDVFSECGGRYRYTRNRQADVIVLSLGGRAYGHFEIESNC